MENNCTSSGLSITEDQSQTSRRVPFRATKLAQVMGIVLASMLTQVEAQDTKPQLKLEVIDPYLEMHSGPGKGYPVFYTIEQGEQVEIMTRRTGWYEVRSQNGRTGWVKAAQIARTLLPTGEPVDLPSVSYGDYLKDSWRIGFNTGQFSSGELEGTNTFSFTAGYRPLSWMGLELESGKFYESELKGNYHSINVLFEPFSEWKLSPVFQLGSGNLKIESQPELAPLDIEDESFSSYGISANYYIGRNFVIRAGLQNYNLSTDNDDERLERWNIGFNAFF
ncbi:SH3 domain-containing protein [Pleionea sp. CnH1-48]|uniref:SH3 domain-containing protein n=1 Tax=Pleionea sp. CnH1-48 TaxID=2954494 RepID=UPI002096F1DB|nr:SH3 domain-containing protein [Pleionea sp. CnH1-48]MCO7223240.1 SH3 domain-containing protein [Pleionea sp. CnH1-48]